ncbi:hypothetical protein KCMC57_up58890 [Kitasatospora sp. CMC57]
MMCRSSAGRTRRRGRCSRPSGRSQLSDPVGEPMCAPRDTRWIESLAPAQNTVAAHPNSTGQLAMGLAVAAELTK